MTQIFPFVPPQNGAFQFQPVMDGDNYNAVVMWNLFANRFYVNLHTTDNTRLFTIPVIGSPQALTLEAAGWSHGYVNAQTGVPHGWLYLSTIPILVAGCVPSTYNGSFQGFVTGPDTFQYALPTDPGGIAAFGTVDFFIDISGGYFNSSTMVYRESLQQFEVNP